MSLNLLAEACAGLEMSSNRSGFAICCYPRLAPIPSSASDSRFAGHRLARPSYWRPVSTGGSKQRVPLREGSGAERTRRCPCVDGSNTPRLCTDACLPRITRSQSSRPSARERSFQRREEYWYGKSRGEGSQDHEGVVEHAVANSAETSRSPQASCRCPSAMIVLGKTSGRG